MINAYKNTDRKPQGMRPLGRPMHRLEVSVKMDLKEKGCKGAIWIEPSQDKSSGELLQM
jgi:hypothetical protein